MWLGLDLGTGSAKALLMSARGEVVAEAAGAYEVASFVPGWAETQPEHWWVAVCRCVNALPAPLRERVRGIGVSGQMHGVVLADAAGQALRPAVLWADSRAVEELARYGPAERERLLNPPTPGMMGPILLWLARHEAPLLRRARWALLPKDWLRLQLVGRAATDPSDASGTLLAGPDGLWDETLVSALRLDASLLPPVQPSASSAGPLLGEAARQLGLPAGIPVAVGAADTAAAALGSGLVEDGAAQLSVGSGAQIIVMRSTCPPRSPRLNAYHAVGGPGLPAWYTMAAMQNAGTALEWVRALFGLSWDSFYERAFAPGQPPSEALFLPYLNGERCPWMNPTARGGWVGLSRSDSQGSLLHAALLGVAYGVRAGYDSLRESGLPVSRLRLAGGGTTRPAWRQLLADVLGCPLDPVELPNASAQGAAWLGAAAAGELPGPLAECVQAGLSAAGGDAIEPRTCHDAGYQRFREVYLGLHAG
ncbi:FGGY family carbohydrate kinase [Aquabacterium sp. A7-Y]|uniref:xylulokinase n=1 Tax=Aquabacterium sp. A7-Y TaxID=1349605 RepID=UPI00223E3011|nr:FGGY family carbohydrate kinase [Aquabacterium sp. A7-Y]MCW7537814.1 FGGY family carbohydrate kinase [Aquabacterium sp. A7-Y]